MKKAGYILVAFGLALLLFVIYGFFQEQNKIHSPIPQNEGIKVIQITPEK
jgi:uncharacterized protein YneF (UPF0154 family)